MSPDKKNKFFRQIGYGTILSFGKIVYLVLMILILVGFSTQCGHEGKVPFALKQKIDNFIIKPVSIFQKENMFLRGSTHYINLKEKDSYNWKIDKNISSGLLEFSFLWVCLKKDIPPSFAPVIKLVVSQTCITNQKHDKKILLAATFDKDKWISKKKRIFLNKKFKNKIEKLNKGDEITFEFFFLNGEAKKSRYGISIPRITALKREKTKTAPANVVLISIDTLRPDYLGIYNKLNKKKSNCDFSPNIDRVAGEATVFLNAYTTESATWPALSSMLLSLYPVEHGCLYNGDFLKYNYFSLAGFLLEQGYQTLSMHANAYSLNISGFEEKYNFVNDNAERVKTVRNADQKLVETAVRKIREQKDAPFFHWYHFIGTHAPYDPPKSIMKMITKDEPYRKFNLKRLKEIMKGKEKVSAADLAYIKKLYSGELFHLDMELKKIFDALKENNLWENTLLFIVSDHGEDLYEHNRFFFHYPSLYDTSIRIPLIIKFPTQQEQIIKKEPVSIMDIFPTIYDYFSGHEGEHSDIVKFSGISLLDLLSGRCSGFSDRVLFSGIENYRITAARFKDWNFIYNPENLQPQKFIHFPYPYREKELYDRGNEPFEKNVISDSKIQGFLIASILKFKKNTGLFKPKTIKQASPVSKRTVEETIKKLKALGYID